jgi:hypothetical protein
MITGHPGHKVGVSVVVKGGHWGAGRGEKKQGVGVTALIEALLEDRINAKLPGLDSSASIANAQMCWSSSSLVNVGKSRPCGI